MTVVIQDKLIFEVPGPWRCWTPPCNPGVATLVVIEIFLGLEDDSLVGPTAGTEAVVVKTFHPLLVVLASEGFGVHRDDRDLAPALRVVVVGWEGEDGRLIPNLSR